MPIGQRVRDEKGQVLIIAGASLVVLVGLIGFSVDVALLSAAQRTLQATTDAAATAAAYDLPNVTNASSRAHEFGAEAGRKNYRAALQGVTLTATWGCDSTVLAGVPCNTVTPSGSTPATANYFQVTQQATYRTTFARVLGITQFTLSATAKSGIPGTGGLRPMNIITIIDSTNSMDNSDSCSATGFSGTSTKLDCVKFGIQNLIGCQSGPCYLDPTLDGVGVAVFPPLRTGTTLSKDYDCSSNLSSSDSASYNASPEGIYSLLTPLSTDYRTSGSSTLNSSSNMVKAVSPAPCGTPSSGSYGIEITGGQGSYWARSIDVVQTYLASLNNNKQNVIIVFSDGDANGNNVPSGSNYHSSAQCRDGIDAAKRAADAGTWVYSIAYKASNSSNCSSDSGITQCNAMRNMAQSPGKTVTGAAAGSTPPDPTKFYSDNSSGCSSPNGITQISQIFQNIGRSLRTTRLIP